MVICFDLDGTVLNTYKLIRETFIRVFKEYYPKFTPTEDDLKSYFGPSLVETFTKVGCTPDEVKMMFTNYRRINDELAPSLIDIYPGVENMLKDLKSKGYKLAIFSNKINKSVTTGITLTKIDKYFDLIVGIDDVVNPKPNREGIDKVRNYFNDEVIYVGDAIGDILTAKNANCLAIGVSQAVTSKEDLLKAGSDYVIENIADLSELLEEICLTF